MPQHTTLDVKLENMSRFLGHAPAGCVVEVGVWQGGSLAHLAVRHQSRQFYGYDTFEGMPESGPLDNTHKKGDFSDTSFEVVSAELAGMPHVMLIKGLYPESDTIRPEKVALAHVDVDLYESTLNALEYLAPRMVFGGRIYCDDAFQGTCEGATIAICEFCARHKQVLKLDVGNHATLQF